MRFFEANQGQVKVGGVDVRELSSEALMAQLSLVMQEVYLFDDSLEATPTRQRNRWSKRHVWQGSTKSSPVCPKAGPPRGRRRRQPLRRRTPTRILQTTGQHEWKWVVRC